jgi:hypothetical protein
VSVAVHNRSIVVIGNAFDATSGGNGFAVVRLTPGGELDPSFGVGGRSLVSVPGSGVTPFASASDGTVRHDGRILVGGYFSGDAAIALVRLHAGLRSNPIRFHENTEREGNAFRLAAPEPCCR